CGDCVRAGSVPARPPPRTALLANPRDGRWLPRGGAARAPPITVWRSDDPTLAYVDLRTIRIARASDLKLPDWAHPLIESNGIPLGFIGNNNGQRTVGLAFDLQQSNLPLTAAFPIFVANVMRFLTPPPVTQTGSLRPGDPAVIQPRPGVDRIVVDGPDGQSWTLTPSDAAARFGQTGRVGLYQITQHAGQQSVAVDQFAVDLFNPTASDLRPRANLTDH